MEEKKSINIGKLKKVFLVILIFLLLLNIFLIFSLTKMYEQKVTEATKPADISIYTIEEACEDCFNIDDILNSIKKQNINIKEENRLTKDQASDLITKYNIQKLPTIIITGEIEKLSLSGFEENNKALLFNSQLPPYYDLSTNSIAGLVELTIINDPTCTECIDLTQVVLPLKQIMTIVKEETLTKSQALSLIEKYNIGKVPTLILSKDVSLYEEIASNWNVYGTVEDDGTYVFRQVLPPYKDLDTNTIRGMVDVIYITDNTCSECYDIKLHKPILERFGIYIKKEETKDITQAKSLLDKYNIEKVPTLLLVGDVEPYESLTQVWSQVGTVEDDGTYVFRDTKQMGKYRDLKTGSVI